MSIKDGILTGKVAVITGASQGLGESLARLFAAEGAEVMLSARNLLALEKISNEINASGFSAAIFTCDVQNLFQVEALAEYTLKRFGKIDIWINNAGIAGPYGRTLDLPVEKFLDVLRTNVIGQYNGSVTALRFFLDQSHGKLINILGRGDDQPVPMQNAYASSKTWVRNFTRALAKEYKKTGIGIFAFNPGLMDTQFLRDIETFPGMEAQLKVMPFLIRAFAAPPEIVTRKILKLASRATDGKTDLYIRNTSRLGLISNLILMIFKNSKRPAELRIRTLPSAFNPLRK